MMGETRVDKLVDELFGKIETAQGYAHCSDGETFATTDQFFERIRQRRLCAIKSVEIFTKFLEKHGALKP